MNYAIISRNNVLLYFNTQNIDHSIQNHFINHSNYLPKTLVIHQIVLLLN